MREVTGASKNGQVLVNLTSEERREHGGIRSSQKASVEDDDDDWG